MKNKTIILLQTITLLLLAYTMLTPTQQNNINYILNQTHFKTTLHNLIPQQQNNNYPYPTINHAYQWNYTCVNYAADLEHKLEQQNKTAGIAILYHLNQTYHTMTAIKENNTIYYADPQTNKHYTAQDIFNQKNKEYKTITTRIVSQFGVEHNPFFIPSNTNH